jgi:hypothetical protein
VVTWFGVMPVFAQTPRHCLRRPRPDVERDQVGDALVRAAEDALLDRRQRRLVSGIRNGGSRLRSVLL